MTIRQLADQQGKRFLDKTLRTMLDIGNCVLGFRFI